MAIAHFGSASAAGGGADTVNITPPASIPAGAAIVLSAGGFCTSSTPTPSGSGWTVVSSSVTSSGSHYCWYKVASGGEGTITVTMDSGVDLFGMVAVDVYTGIDTSAPLGAHGAESWSGVSHASGTTSPSVNNVNSGAMALFVGTFYNGASGTGQSTPTNMTSAYVAGDSSSSNCFGFYRLNAPTGSQSYTTTPSAGETDWYGGATLLFLKVAPAATNAPAGRASATAAASNATVTKAVAPLAGLAAATAAAGAPTTPMTFSVGVAAASSAALGPTTKVAPSGPLASAAAAANDATVSTQGVTQAPAGLAAATASALAPGVRIAFAAGLAAASGAALDASTAKAVAPVAGVASATAAANNSLSQIKPSAALATAATAAAYNATISTKIETNPNAGLAAAVATALDATTNAAPIITPAERIYTIDAEDRKYVIAGDW